MSSGDPEGSAVSVCSPDSPAMRSLRYLKSADNHFNAVARVWILTGPLLIAMFGKPHQYLLSIQAQPLFSTYCYVSERQFKYCLHTPHLGSSPDFKSGGFTYYSQPSPISPDQTLNLAQEHSAPRGAIPGECQMIAGKEVIQTSLPQNRETIAVSAACLNRDEMDCRFCGQIGFETRWNIIEAYLRVLEQMSEPLAVESDLPFSKEEIRHAIFQELTKNPTSEWRQNLEIAFVQLESFIPYEEYRIVADFKNASLLAQELADMRDPTSIIRSASIMKRARGDRAVDIQEKISERMKRSMMLIQEAGEAGVSPNAPRKGIGHYCS